MGKLPSKMILQLLALKDFFGLVTVTDGLHNSVSGFEKKKVAYPEA
jgi:hypothetical protein